MKKFDGKHKKRIGRKKRELMAWRAKRAAVYGVRVKTMLTAVRLGGDPLLKCAKRDD